MLRNLGRLLLVLALSLSSIAALAHDVWIHRGAWCCDAEDCGVVAPGAVKTGVGGYSVRGPVTYGVGVTGNAEDGPTRQENLNEVVPYSQSLPSPDGAYWRCKRPDGSPRCFFALPSGS